MLYTQCERISYALNHFVDINLTIFKYRFLTVIHAHLQHFFYQETQTTAFIIDNSSQMRHHRLIHGHTLVIQHLCS